VGGDVPSELTTAGIDPKTTLPDRFR
jgi:hypothetical protein